MRPRHIDLDRHFLDYDQESDSETAAALSYLGFAGGLSRWPDLLEHGRVVLLGEAGSGKTWEMEAQADGLKSAGRTAFFIRIDELAHRDLAAAIDPVAADQLSRWRGGTGEATFLLDAKDEAQLADHHAFERALRTFARDLGGGGLARARIIISCRVSEWQPITDVETVSRLLGSPPARGSAMGISQKGRGGTVKTPIPQVRVVQLAPLDQAQVRCFVSKRLDVGDPEPFLLALDQAYAWDFARRPRDIDTLLAYWERNGRLGALHELIEHDITHKLTEENPTRVTRDPLDADKARRGAEALAAAVILSRRFVFPLPAPSATRIDHALDARAVLTDWCDGEIRALLGRALFDEAAYGKIRFHHRGLVDYLAARWFERLTKDNCPQRAIIRLLFRDIYGRTVVPPSLAPVAAWLAAWLPSVRKTLLAEDPDILLRHGDPSLVPLSERQSLLKHVAEQCRFRTWEDKEQLGRLADPDLSSTINDLLADSAVSDGVKEMLLVIVREGRLAACGGVCLDIAANPLSGSTLRLYAIRALDAIGDEHHLRTLTDRIMGGPELTESMAGRACRVLYPRILDEAGLELLLLKVRNVPRHSLTRLPDILADSITARLPDERISSVINLLVNLSRMEPWVVAAGTNRPSDVSSRFLWVYTPLLAAICRALAQPDLAGMSPATVATAIDQLTQIREFLGSREERGVSLHNALAAHPSVRRAQTLAQIRRRRSMFSEDQIWIATLESYWALWHLEGRDISWLLEDARHAPEPQDRRMAFKLAIQLWTRSARPITTRIKFMMMAAVSPELWRVYYREMSNSVSQTWFRARQCFYRLRLYSPRFWRLRHRIRQRWNRSVLFWHVVCRFNRLRRGEDWPLLYNLMDAGDNRRTIIRRYEERSVEGITQVFGTWVASLVRSGLKFHWRKWQPPLPEGHMWRIPYALVASLVGIKADLDDGLVFSNLSPEEADIAARLSLHEINGFPSWLPQLVATHPLVIKDIFTRQIRAELALPSDNPPVGLISQLRNESDDSCRTLCAPVLLDAIATTEPENFSILSDAVGALMSQGNVSALAGLAERYGRAACVAGDQERLSFWLSFWLQTDAGPALDFLESHLAAHPEQADAMILALAANLDPTGGHAVPLLDRPSYGRPTILRRLIPLLHRHIRPEEDIQSDGVYTPGTRDSAQHFRSHVIGLLCQSVGREAHDILCALADDPALAQSRDLFLYHALQRAKLDAEGSPWSAEQLTAFRRQYECAPTTADELFALILGRFEDIIDQAERGDFSLRGHFKSDDDEAVLQKWLAGQLDSMRRGVYEVAREVEVANRKKPDIRLFCSGIDPVTIEGKWAHKWSFNDLRIALKTQLLGQYMCTNRSRHGILLLANLEPTRTWVPTGKPALGFRELCKTLDKEAEALVTARGKGERMTVLGVELSMA